MDGKDEQILKYLKEKGKLCVKDIADGVGMSPATTSKYLFSLLSQKKVKKDVKLPYTYYEAAQHMFAAKLTKKVEAKSLYSRLPRFSELLSSIIPIKGGGSIK